MNLMETFSNPSTFDSLSTSDKLLGSSITLAIGMGITFLILILLWFIIVMMSKILGAFDNKKAVATVGVDAASSTGSEDLAEGELFAVITAAILAAEGDNPAASKLVVRKIKRTNDAQAPWARAGIEDCANSRKDIN